MLSGCQIVKITKINCKSEPEIYFFYSEYILKSQITCNLPRRAKKNIFFVKYSVRFRLIPPETVWQLVNRSYTETETVSLGRWNGTKSVSVRFGSFRFIGTLTNECVISPFMIKKVIKPRRLIDALSSAAVITPLLVELNKSSTERRTRICASTLENLRRNILSLDESSSPTRFLRQCPSGIFGYSLKFQINLSISTLLRSTIWISVQNICRKLLNLLLKTLNRNLKCQFDAVWYQWFTLVLNLHFFVIGQVSHGNLQRIYFSSLLVGYTGWIPEFCTRAILV